MRDCKKTLAWQKASEVAGCIHRAHRPGDLTDAGPARRSEQADEASRVLTGLIRSVKKEAAGKTRGMRLET